MFNHRHYVPILKWKQGEYQALTRLRETVKSSVTPLLEIPKVGYDFKEKKNRETIDEHLSDFGTRLKAKWGSRPCFVDVRLLGTDCMTNGNHCLGYVFAKARQQGCSATPVIRLDCDPAFIAAASGVAKLDGRGLCLRLRLDDFDVPQLSTAIEELLKRLGVSWGDTDLVIDCESPNYKPVSAFVRTTSELLDMVPNINKWRTLTIAGTSYPPSVANLATPYEMVPRMEWTAYKALVSSLSPTDRIPTFGDYGPSHHEALDLDMRIVKPLAKLRYTVDDAWYIARGNNVRTNGFGQYRGMCEDLSKHSAFSGSNYSAADKYIVGCATGQELTGSLTTWVWVATNRHVTKVVSDLSSLHGI